MKLWVKLNYYHIVFSPHFVPHRNNLHFFNMSSKICSATEESWSREMNNLNNWIMSVSLSHDQTQETSCCSMCRTFAFVIVGLHKVCVFHLQSLFRVWQERNVGNLIWDNCLQPLCWRVCACITVHGSIQTHSLSCKWKSGIDTPHYVWLLAEPVLQAVKRHKCDVFNVSQSGQIREELAVNLNKYLHSHLPLMQKRKYIIFSSD